jgi:hypothetical protein
MSTDVEGISHYFAFSAAMSRSHPRSGVHGYLVRMVSLPAVLIDSQDGCPPRQARCLSSSKSGALSLAEF